MVVHGQESGKFKSMNQFADSGRNFIDPAVHQGCQRRISGHEAAFPGCPGLDSADPAVQHQCQRTALGLGLCGQVPDQLPVGREPLTARSLQPALRRQIRIRDDNGDDDRWREDRKLLCDSESKSDCSHGC